MLGQDLATVASWQETLAAARARFPRSPVWSWLSRQIRVAENAKGMAALERRAETVLGLGFQHEEVIGHNTLRRLEPALADHMVGGLITRDDGFADPLRTIHAYRRRPSSYIQGNRNAGP